MIMNNLGIVAEVFCLAIASGLESLSDYCISKVQQDPLEKPKLTLNPIYWNIVSNFLFFTSKKASVMCFTQGGLYKLFGGAVGSQCSDPHIY